jgi:16S rRNA (guanine527-N7)-methyltransferase
MEIILKYFPDLTENQILQFKKLDPFYRHWNQQINLISRNDLENIYERHVLHSLAIAKVLNPGTPVSILDVGTGGGFPGIPLAIAFPGVRFHLVDSIGKKIRVVRTLIDELELRNVSAEQTRVESMNKRFDMIVSRAVTNMKEFIPLIKNRLNPSKGLRSQNGIYYLKGGDVSNEMSTFKKYDIYKLSDFFQEPFFESKLLIHIPEQSV